MSGGEKARILVIDDDEIATTAIRSTLQEAGFEVWTLLSAVGASQVITRNRIQLVVVDVNMPVLRGDRMVKLARSCEDTAHLPFVLVSGMEESALKELSEKLTNVSYVAKANVASELVKVVRAILGQPAADEQTAWRPDIDVTRAFTRQLSSQLTTIMELWDRLAAQDEQAASTLRRMLHDLKGEAHLTGLKDLAVLLEKLSEVADSYRGQTPPSAVTLSVYRAVGLASGLVQRNPNIAPSARDTALKDLDQARRLLTGA